MQILMIFRPRQIDELVMKGADIGEIMRVIVEVAQSHSIDEEMMSDLMKNLSYSVTKEKESQDAGSAPSQARSSEPSSSSRPHVKEEQREPVAPESQREPETQSQGDVQVRIRRSETSVLNELLDDTSPTGEEWIDFDPSDLGDQALDALFEGRKANQNFITYISDSQELRK